MDFESAFPTPSESFEEQPETTTTTPITATTEYIPDTTIDEEDAEIIETDDESNNNSTEDDEAIFGKKKPFFQLYIPKEPLWDSPWPLLLALFFCFLIISDDIFLSFFPLLLAVTALK